MEPLASGEARTVRLEIPTRTDAHFVGRVVDAESGKPIPGARVHVPGRRLFVGGGGSPWSGTSLTRPDVSTTSNEADQEFRTGPEGWFEVTLPTGRRQAWQVDAKGFGPKMFQPDGSHGDRERALVVRLQRAATLRATWANSSYSRKLTDSSSRWGPEPGRSMLFSAARGSMWTGRG